MDETEYTDGAVVWVKLAGGKWWPGQVVARDTCPDDLLKGRKKDPVAIVKFFEEDALEVVKTPQHIHPFQGYRKDEFIRKGQEMSKVTDKWAGKFNVDVARAERLCAPPPPPPVQNPPEVEETPPTEVLEDKNADTEEKEDKLMEKKETANVNDFDLQEVIDEEMNEHRSDASEKGSANGDTAENSTTSNHIESSANHKDSNCMSPPYAFSPSPHSNDSSTNFSHMAYKSSFSTRDRYADEYGEFYDVRIRLQPLGPVVEPTGHSCIHCSYQTRRMSNLLRHYKDHYRSGAALDGYQHLGFLTKRKAEKPKRSLKGSKVPRKKSSTGGDSEKKKKDVSAQTPKGRKRKSAAAAVGGDSVGDATGNGSGPVTSTPASGPSKRPKKKGESAFDQIRRGTVIPRANRRHRFIRGMAGDDRPHGSDSSDEEFLITRAVFGESSDSEEEDGDGEEEEEEEVTGSKVETENSESVNETREIVEKTLLTSAASEVDTKKDEEPVGDNELVTPDAVEDREDTDNAIMAEASKLLEEKAPEVPKWEDDKKDPEATEADEKVATDAKVGDEEERMDDTADAVVVAEEQGPPTDTVPDVEPQPEPTPTSGLEEQTQDTAVVQTSEIVEDEAPVVSEVEVPTVNLQQELTQEAVPDETQIPSVAEEPSCANVPTQVLMDVEAVSSITTAEDVNVVEAEADVQVPEEAVVLQLDAESVEESEQGKEVVSGTLSSLSGVNESEEMAKVPEVMEEPVPVAVEEIQIVEEVKMDCSEAGKIEVILPSVVATEEGVDIIIEEVEETKAEVERPSRGGRGRGVTTRGGRLGPRGRFGRGGKAETPKSEKPKAETSKKTPRQEPKKVQFLTDKPDVARLLEPVPDMPSPRGGRGPLRVYTPRPKAVRDKEKAEAEELLKAKAAEERLKQDEVPQAVTEPTVDEPKATEEEVLLEVVTAPPEDEIAKPKLTATVSTGSPKPQSDVFADIGPRKPMIQVVKKSTLHHAQQEQKTIIELTPVAPIVMSSLQNMDMPCQVLTIDEMGEVQAVVESGTELIQVATEQVIETHMDDDIFCNEVVIDSEDKASQESDEVEEDVVVCLEPGNNANNADAKLANSDPNPKQSQAGTGKDKETAAPGKPVVVAAGGPGDHIALFTGDPALATTGDGGQTDNLPR